MRTGGGKNTAPSMRLLTEKDQQDVKADTHNDSLSPQPHLGDLSQLEQAVNYTMNE